MNLDGYITAQEAADLLGVSRTTVYRRLRTARVLYADSTDGNGEQYADSRPDSILQGKNRYISREWVEAQGKPVQNANSTRTEPVQYADSTRTANEHQADRLKQLEVDLLEAQGKVATLQATVDAQQAHIDSLKQALDREQALHMASLQQRLPAGRGRFMDWIRGRRGEE